MLQAFQYTTKQSWLKIKDEKTHSAVQKCYMAQQAVQKSDMAQQAVQQSYMAQQAVQTSYVAQQAVQKIYMAQYIKSFSKCCRHFNKPRNNHGYRLKTKKLTRPYRNAIWPSRLYRNPIWPSRLYRNSIWLSRPYKKFKWPNS